MGQRGAATTRVSIVLLMFVVVVALYSGGAQPIYLFIPVTALTLLYLNNLEGGVRYMGVTELDDRIHFKRKADGEMYEEIEYIDFEFKKVSETVPKSAGNTLIY